jgi:hypothetical protein
MVAAEYHPVMVSPIRKRPFISSRFVAPLGAVATLLVIFLIYYFVGITEQEASVDDRAFRSLAAISNQFKDLINTYATAFQGAAEKESGPIEKEKSGKGGFGTDSQAPQILSSLAAQGSNLSDVDVCSSSPEGEFLRSPKAPKNVTANVVARSFGYSVELASNGWCGHEPIENALLPLITELPGQIFDDIVLADSSGTVLYQTRRSGVITDNLSLLPFQFPEKGSTAPKGAPPTKTAEKNELPFGLGGASNLFVLPLAGTTYRVYMVPVRLAVRRPSPSPTGAGIQLVLCGLILQRHFTTQSRSLPLTMLVAVALGVFLVIVGTWPLLKFATMRRTEQIARQAGLFYSMSMALTTIVTILLVTHLYYGFSDPKTDNNLEDLAKAIDRNVGRELQDALRAMESVGALREVKHAFASKDESQQLCTDTSDGKDPLSKTDLLSNAGMEVSDYPYFRRLFVFDSLGFERVSWTVDATAPSPLRVCNRPYFQGVQRNDLWYLSDQGLSGAHFRVDPVYSKSTGEYLTAIARPYTLEAENQPVDHGVMAIFTRMIAVTDPVLPPDYGFAVIDAAGKVLFHSDETKNGRENFFDELGDSRALRAAALARHPRWSRGPYMGGDYSFFISPFNSIQGCPWSLVVFSNRAVLGDKALERSLLVALLCAMYFMVLAVAVTLLRLLLPCHRMAWPVDTMIGGYCHLALVLGVVVLLTYALIFQANISTLLIFAVLVPVSGIAFSILKVRGFLSAIAWTASLSGAAGLTKIAVSQPRSLGSPYLIACLICAAYLTLGSKSFARYFGSWKKPSLRTAYSLGCFALLILVAGIPCVAFFKCAYDYDESLATRRQQLLTLSALNRREQRVVDQYFQINISGKHRAFADDLGKWLFLRRRLQEQRFDLYDKAFRGQSAGQIMPGHEIAGWPSWWVYLATKLVPHRSESLTPMVAADCTDGSKWRWNEAGANRVHIQPSYSTEVRDNGLVTCASLLESQAYSHSEAPSSSGSPETLALHKLAMQDPLFLEQALTYHVDVLRAWEFLGLTAFSLSILLAAMFLSLRSTLTKMFLLKWKVQAAPSQDPKSQDAWHRDAWPEITVGDAVDKGNCILVRLPSLGTTDWQFKNSDKVAVLDLAVTYNAATPPIVGIVLLDHFEHGMTNPSRMQSRLALLEELLTANKKVVIVTTIDPVYYLDDAANDSTFQPVRKDLARDAERWALVLARFSTFRLSDTSDVAASPLYYQLLWASCTWTEKIALHGLIEQGWPNYKNYAALNHLWNRGLIKADPNFHLTDPKLGEFVSGQVTELQRRAWRLHDTSGVWDGLRTALIVLLLGGLGALLFFSQKDIPGIVVTAASALTAVTKIISELRSGRTGGGKGGTQVA